MGVRAFLVFKTALRRTAGKCKGAKTEPPSNGGTMDETEGDMVKRQGQLKKKKVEARRKAYVEAMKKNAETAKHTDSMIRRITLKDVATFSSEGATLNDLQRVNFVYGGNGCGKTTISRLLEEVNRLKITD